MSSSNQHLKVKQIPTSSESSVSSTPRTVFPLPATLAVMDTTSWADITEEEEKEEELAKKKFFHDLSAVPAGLVAGARGASMRPRARKGKKGKSKKTELISKSFNTVANRPSMAPAIKNRPFSTYLSYTISSAYASTTVTTAVAGLAFTLAGFAQYTEYTSLFDQYRFDMLELHFEPQQSQSTVVANTGQYVTCIDLDDASTPGSYNSVLAHSTALVTEGFTGHYHRWEPHMAVAVYSGAFTSFANAPANWIDVGSPNVQHYGLKLAILPTSAVITYNVSIRAKISFRQAGI